MAKGTVNERDALMRTVMAILYAMVSFVVRRVALKTPSQPPSRTPSPVLRGTPISMSTRPSHVCNEAFAKAWESQFIAICDSHC